MSTPTIGIVIYVAVAIITLVDCSRSFKMFCMNNWKNEKKRPFSATFLCGWVMIVLGSQQDCECYDCWASGLGMNICTPTTVGIILVCIPLLTCCFVCCGGKSTKKMSEHERLLDCEARRRMLDNERERNDRERKSQRDNGETHETMQMQVPTAVLIATAPPTPSTFQQLLVDLDLTRYEETLENLGYNHIDCFDVSSEQTCVAELIQDAKMMKPHARKLVKALKRINNGSIF